MRRRIPWPNGCDFAFTVVDDTDGATVKNVKPVYDYLYEKGLLTTKTCWTFPVRDTVFSGECLEDEEYLGFLLELRDRGFELGFHNAGSGGFTREETLRAFEIFREKLGTYPRMHINHANNIENMYWGAKRFSPIVRKLYSLVRKNIPSRGDEEGSEYFWGDVCKEHVKYIRNRTFRDINTLRADPRLVYAETGKEKHSNYWFSSSDGMRLAPFLKLLSKKNVDRLVRQKGCCIVYTHFAYDFVDGEGNLSEDFKSCIDYLASQNGWFAPAGEILDYVLADREYRPSRAYETKKDFKWFFERIAR